MKMKISSIIALIVLIASAAASAASPFVPTDRIMRISEVRPGMIGECRTVIRGTEQATFPVEVLDVVSSSGSPKDLILIRAYGPAIEETGGIAAGMSGSPIYIGGRLVGAIGYGWNFSRHDIGLATSIEDMIRVWDNPERIPSFSPAPIIPEAPASEDASPVRSLDLASRAMPIYVGGVSAGAARDIGTALGMEVVPFASGPGEREPKRVKYGASMRPGDAIGVSLVWGDVEVSAIGTMSAVAKDGRCIAFAHPFLGRGWTSAALTEARIARVIPSMHNPFKLGRTGDIVGVITQDRPEGIGGRMGQFAPAASCRITVDDVDAGRKRTKAFQMVSDPFILSTLSTRAAAGAIEDMWARGGGGSAKVVTRFTGGALMDGWTRTNIFVSEKDVIKEMMEEHTTLVNIFSLNQFQELRPFGVEMDVELTGEPRVLYIEDVKVPDGPFAPGSTVSFDITLRAWRRAPETHSYSLVVPKNVAGTCQLMVRGGGIAEETAEYMEAKWRSISSLPILLKELDAKESNDQIVLEIRGQEALDEMIKKAKAGSPSDMMNEKLKSEMVKEKKAEGSMRVIRTNYAVDGMVQKLIRVEDEAQSDGGDDDEDTADQR